MRFQFTNEDSLDYVAADKYYEILDTPQHGFLTEVNRNKYERLQIPEINDAFMEVFWYEGEEITDLQADKLGIYVNYVGQGELPLTFVTDVEQEGNYLVSVSFTAATDVDNAMVFLGRRRLAYLGNVNAGQVVKVQALANICPIIARGSDQPREDLTLDVTLIGKGLRLQEIICDRWQGPTIYVAGDSTVTDQSAAYPYLPWNSYAAWGQMLSYFVGTQAAVSNHAHSGLTTESFRTEGHYDILINRVKAGDYVLFQFGHNDQKLMHLKSNEGYRDRLIAYISEVREKGAIPIIISPLARNSWKKVGDVTMYNDLLEDYAKECELLAKEFDLNYIDLHGQAMNLIKKNGRDESKRLFFPGDYTHTNDYGAYHFASVVYDGLKDAGVVTSDNDKAAWVPPTITFDLDIPDEYRNRKNPDSVDMFVGLDRLGDELTRVEAMDFIIKTCKFFPTNVYNDYFTDVIGHETYAGTVECAYQNGMITEDMVADGCFYPEKKISVREFIVSLMNGYSARKSLGNTGDLLAEARTLGLLSEADNLEASLTRGEAADICRKLTV